MTQFLPKRHDLTQVKACSPTTQDLHELEFAYRRALQLLTRILLHADINEVGNSIPHKTLNSSVREFILSNSNTGSAFRVPLIDIGKAG